MDQKRSLARAKRKEQSETVVDSGSISKTRLRFTRSAGTLARTERAARRFRFIRFIWHFQKHRFRVGRARVPALPVASSPPPQLEPLRLAGLWLLTLGPFSLYLFAPSVANSAATIERSKPFRLKETNVASRNLSHKEPGRHS